MPTEKSRWTLPPPFPGGPNPALLEAARHCREHHCEASVAALLEAVYAAPRDYAIPYQLGICCGGCRQINDIFYI